MRHKKSTAQRNHGLLVVGKGQITGSMGLAWAALASDFLRGTAFLGALDFLRSAVLLLGDFLVATTFSLF